MLVTKAFLLCSFSYCGLFQPSFFLFYPLSAKDAMDDGCSPVIIDNTNIQAWEMQPYVKMVGGDITCKCI